jgi:hypothetical protein
MNPGTLRGRDNRNDRFWQILLQKSFWRDDRKLSGPLVRFARGDMRDHIVSRRNDHGASYRSYGVLQWRSRLKINVCEIFGVVRFSTFATKSALSGRGAMSELSPLSGAKRKWDFGAVRAAFDPTATLAAKFAVMHNHAPSDVIISARANSRRGQPWSVL